MATVSCTECDAGIELTNEAILGEITQCPECGVELEIISTEPLQLALAPEVEEDWGE